MVTHPSGVYFVHVFVIFHAHLCTYAYAVTRLGDGKQCFSISTIPRRVRKTTAHSYSLPLHCFQYNVDKLHKQSGVLPHHIPFRRIAQTVETTVGTPAPRWSITLHHPPLLEDFHNLQWNIQAIDIPTISTTIRNFIDGKAFLLSQTNGDQRWPTACSWSQSKLGPGFAFSWSMPLNPRILKPR